MEEQRANRGWLLMLVGAICVVLGAIFFGIIGAGIGAFFAGGLAAKAAGAKGGIAIGAGVISGIATGILLSVVILQWAFNDPALKSASSLEESMVMGHNFAMFLSSTMGVLISLGMGYAIGKIGKS